MMRQWYIHFNDGFTKNLCLKVFNKTNSFCLSNYQNITTPLKFRANASQRLNYQTFVNLNFLKQLPKTSKIGLPRPCLNTLTLHTSEHSFIHCTKPSSSVCLKDVRPFHIARSIWALSTLMFSTWHLNLP